MYEIEDLDVYYAYKSPKQRSIYVLEKEQNSLRIICIGFQIVLNKVYMIRQSTIGKCLKKSN